VKIRLGRRALWRPLFETFSFAKSTAPVDEFLVVGGFEATTGSDKHVTLALTRGEAERIYASLKAHFERAAEQKDT
jgi:hypothetical protein